MLNSSGVRPGKRHIPVLAAIGALVAALHLPGILNPSFGPELALFFSLNDGLTFTELFKTYWNFDQGWYRPTAFYLPYWLAMHFIGWHDIAALKTLHVLSLASACWTLYALALTMGYSRTAGFAAALYLAVFPGAYSIVLQSSAFDCLHLMFVHLTVICYWIGVRRGGGRQAWNAIGAASLAYAAALTSKELTLAAPGFLLLVSASHLWENRAWRQWKQQAGYLSPFTAIAALYLLLHVIRMPAAGAQGAYRTGWNSDLIAANLLQFPLWIARIFGGTGDLQVQTRGHDHPLNTMLGLAIFALAAAAWMPEIRRDRASRGRLLLLAGWVAVFLTIPVYSGGYLWHCNLALCAYAIFAGHGLSKLIESFHSGRARRIASAAMLGILCAAGLRSGRDVVRDGIHAHAYGINTRKALSTIPKPSPEIPIGSGIYFDDAPGFGSWAYGGGHLFAFIYKRKDLSETPVPTKIDLPQRAEFLTRDDTFYFRNNHGEWQDSTWPFRLESIGVLPGYTGDLIGKNECAKVTAYLDGVFRLAAARQNFLLQYHQGYCLLQLKRFAAAQAALTASLELKPDYAFALLQRGTVHREQGDTRRACDDYRAAEKLDREAARYSVSKWCR